MKKTLTLFFLIGILTISACAPLVNAAPEPLPATQPLRATKPVPATQPATSVETQISTAVTPTQVDQSAIFKPYLNSAFGLGFQYPSNWFGPDEYVSGQILRVSVGSDKVYPYGETPEQPSEVKNSYSVVIQYSKNDQRQFWKDTYQSLLNLKDGESLSGSRSLITRVRKLDLGRFEGFEYISTLSQTAQTDHVYGREVILIDKQSNLLTISGTPNNVEISNGTEWRDVYQMIDKANLTFFHKIVESIKIE